MTAADLAQSISRELPFLRRLRSRGDCLLLDLDEAEEWR